MTKITKYYIREWSKYVSNKSEMKTDAILKIAKKSRYFTNGAESSVDAA